MFEVVSFEGILIGLVYVFLWSLRILALDTCALFYGRYMSSSGGAMRIIPGGHARMPYRFEGVDGIVDYAKATTK